MRRFLIGACLGVLFVLLVRLLSMAGSAETPIGIRLIREHWTPSNTHTVYLFHESAREVGAINGANGFRGPTLMLDRPDRLGQLVRIELERLRPCEIVAPKLDSVSDEALVEADAFTVEDDKCNDPRELQRLRELSDAAFERTLDAVNRQLEEMHGEDWKNHALPV